MNKFKLTKPWILWLLWLVQALGLGDIKDTDKAVIFKNRAMCQLKLDKYEKAVADATEGLPSS